jgi:DNA polymerase III epsilon subunit family exonuclease
MTKWRVAALIAVATIVPALTVAVVLADLDPAQRSALAAAVRDQAWVLLLGLAVLVGGIGALAWSTWRSEQRAQARTAAAIDIISEANPDHRLPGDAPVDAAVNRLASRHAGAEERLEQRLEAAHAELRRERDALLAVLSGLDVPVGVIDDAGRVLLVNPAARRELGGRSQTPIAAGRSIFSVFDAEDLTPLLAAALAGGRPAASVGGDTAVRLLRITGPSEPPMVLVIGSPGAADDAPALGLSADLARPSRPIRSRQEWLETPLPELVCTVLDTETTGLHVAAGDRLLSLAAVRVDGGVVRSDDTFDALINPGRAIPASSIAFHGITDEVVATAPPAEEVVAQFAAYAADSVLVGHQLAFDLGFLQPVAAAAGISLEPLALDTMLLSAVLDPDPEARHGLDYVCQRFGVEVVGRHTALGDALATAELLVVMIPLLQQRGIVTLGDARRAAAESEVAKRLR